MRAAGQQNTHLQLQYLWLLLLMLLWLSIMPNKLLLAQRGKLRAAKRNRMWTLMFIRTSLVPLCIGRGHMRQTHFVLLFCCKVWVRAVSRRQGTQRKRMHLVQVEIVGRYWRYATRLAARYLLFFRFLHWRLYMTKEKLYMTNEE